MSFYYVDRIFEISPQSIRGLKNITHNESFFYQLPNGDTVISPAVITEALAQLGAWLQIHNADFKMRPVLLSDELTEYRRFVRPGEQLDLRVKLIGSDDEVLSSYGEAYVGQELVAVSHHCRGYLLAMEDFEDSDAARARFQQIYRPEERPTVGAQGFMSLSRVMPQPASFVDGIVKCEAGRSVIGFKNFALSEQYFATHFPRKPVVPGVLLMTLIGELAQALPPNEEDSIALLPTFMRNVRFRKFVEPGDQVLVDLQVLHGRADVDDSDVLVRAQMHANGQRVMTGEVGFRTMVGSSVAALSRQTAVEPMFQ